MTYPEEIKAFLQAFFANTQPVIVINWTDEYKIASNKIKSVLRRLLPQNIQSKTITTEFEIEGYNSTIIGTQIAQFIKNNKHLDTKFTFVVFRNESQIATIKDVIEYAIKSILINTTPNYKIITAQKLLEKLFSLEIDESINPFEKIHLPEVSPYHQDPDRLKKSETLFSVKQNSSR